MNETTDAQRLIVVGASAGGPPALRALVAALDPELAAAVLIVQHSASSMPRLLAEVLQAAGPLPADYARDGEALEPGRILIAPPDHHLAVQDGRARVVRGPRQNRSRPSIDVLFRSAAVAGGARTIGLLLSGLLHDGALGLEAIKRCGGLTAVQDPAEALFPDMVQHALETVQVDQRLPLAELAALLNRLAREPVPAKGSIPEDLRQEVRISLSASSSEQQRRLVGDVSGFSCPDCGGRLWQTEEGLPKHYICEVGHSYDRESLLQGQTLEVERALYIALRTLEERTRMLEHMASEDKKQGHVQFGNGLDDRAAEARENAEAIRRLLLQRAGYTCPGAKLD